MSQQFDVAISGDSLSSWILAGAFAEKGKKVLFCLPGEKDKLVAQQQFLLPQFSELDRNLDFQFLREVLESAHVQEKTLIGVAVDKIRILLNDDYSILNRELQLNLKDSELHSISAIVKNLIDFIESHPEAFDKIQWSMQNQTRQLKQWESKLGPLACVVNVTTNTKSLESSPWWPMFYKIFAPLVAAQSAVTPVKLSAAQLLKGLAEIIRHRGHSFVFYESLQKRVAALLESTNGVILENAHFRSLVEKSETNQMAGVELSTPMGVVYSQQFVIGCEHALLYRSLPNQKQDKYISSALDRFVPTHFRHRILLQLPAKMLNDLGRIESFLVTDTLIANEEENFLHVQPNLSDAEKSRVLVTALVPLLLSKINDRYLQNLSMRMLDRLDSVLPFAAEFAEFLTPDPRQGGVDFSKQYNWLENGRVVRDIDDSLKVFYLRGTKGQQSFYGLPWRTNIENVFFAGSAVWPSMGWAGEWDVVKNIYNTIFPKF